jgi:hypothetical protein
MPSPGHRQGTDRRPDRARAALTGLTSSLPRVPRPLGWRGPGASASYGLK